MAKYNIPNIGRGKHMSIAKAALKYYYEECDFYKSHNEKAFLNYGNLPAMHRIIDIAGAKHCSFFTAAQVTGCLANSPYWMKLYINGYYSGMRGHGGANTFQPSEKGKKYYKEKLEKKD